MRIRSVSCVVVFCRKRISGVNFLLSFIYIFSCFFSSRHVFSSLLVFLFSYQFGFRAHLFMCPEWPLTDVSWTSLRIGVTSIFAELLRERILSVFVTFSNNLRNYIIMIQCPIVNHLNFP